MVEIEIDGKKVEVPEGSMVMHAADKAGTYIPHFCYHKKLSIAANCRMCLVDVEKAPKAMPACATMGTSAGTRRRPARPWPRPLRNCVQGAEKSSGRSSIGWPSRSRTRAWPSVWGPPLVPSAPLLSSQA